jgi:hypothetical protein
MVRGRGKVWGLMYYVGQDGQIQDDGHGLDTAPAYALSRDGSRLELEPPLAEDLTRRFLTENRSRLPIGDLVAAVARGFGIEACAPCKRRQAALNRFGDRVARPFGR